MEFKSFDDWLNEAMSERMISDRINELTKERRPLSISFYKVYIDLLDVE